MKPIIAILSALLVAAPVVDAVAQTRVTRTTNVYYGHRQYYHGGCGNCWIGPAAGVATGVFLGAVVGSLLAPPPPSTVVIERSPPIQPRQTVVIRNGRECLQVVRSVVNGVPMIDEYCR